MTRPPVEFPLCLSLCDNPMQLCFKLPSRYLVVQSLQISEFHSPSLQHLLHCLLLPVVAVRVCAATCNPSQRCQKSERDLHTHRLCIRIAFAYASPRTAKLARDLHSQVLHTQRPELQNSSRLASLALRFKIIQNKI